MFMVMIMIMIMANKDFIYILGDSKFPLKPKFKIRFYTKSGC